MECRRVLDDRDYREFPPIFLLIIIFLASNKSQTDDLFVGETNVSSGGTVT